MVAAEKYLRVKELVDTLAAAESVRAEFFWQPDALASPLQREAATAFFGSSPIMAQIDMDETLRVANEALEGEVHNLRHSLDDESEVVFLDSAHTNEYAASVVAEAMYAELRSEVRRRAGLTEGPP